MTESTYNRVYTYIGLILFLLFVFLRYQNIPGVFSDRGIIPPGTDSYYRLHRIYEMVQHGWNYPLFDPKLYFPSGWNVAWPLGLDLMIAAPIKLLGLRDQNQIISAACLIFPIFSIPLFFLIISVVTTYSNRWLGLCAGWFIAIAPAIIYQSSVGQIGHHIFGALFAIFHLYLFLQLKNKNSLGSKIFLILSFGLSSAFFPHGWLSCLMLNLALLIETDSALLRKISVIYLIAFIVSLAPLSLSPRFENGYVSIAGFSWWPSLMLVASSVYVSLFRFVRSKFSFQSQDLLSFIAFVGTIGFLFQKNSFFLWAELRGGVDWLLHQNGTLHHTVESESILAFEPERLAEGWLIYLMPIVFLWFVRRKKFSFLLLYSLIPISFSFFQIRFIVTAYPLIITLCVLFLWDLLFVIDEQRIINWKLTTANKLSAICIVSILVFLIAFPSPVFKHYNTHDNTFYSIRLASQFIRNKIEREHMDPSQTGIIGAWDYGHWILFYSNLPIVASPFQEPSGQDVTKLFTSESADDFTQFEKKYPAKYLMIEQSFERFWMSLENIGKDPHDYFIKQVDYESNVYEPTKKFENVFYYRFLMRLGEDDLNNAPKNWRLIFVSPVSSQYSYNLPGVKVFEKVNGVKIEHKSSVKDLWLTVTVKDKFGFKKQLRQKSEFDGQVHHWTMPYSQYGRGDVFCDGIYHVIDKNRKEVAVSLPVSDNDVVSGSVIHAR